MFDQFAREWKKRAKQDVFGEDGVVGDGMNCLREKKKSNLEIGYFFIRI